MKTDFFTFIIQERFSKSADSALAFVLRILLERSDWLVSLRYYETEIRALLTTLLNGVYLVWKDGLYSEVFYNLYHHVTPGCGCAPTPRK